MRKIFLLSILLLPLLTANKGCVKKDHWEHPPVTNETSCQTCHDDGRTRQTPPPGHNQAWKRDHGVWIKKFGFKPDSECRLCHTESHCSSCHQQEKPRNHTEFWRLKGHGLAVGLDRSSCLTCHRGADFCQRCHADTKPISHTAAWGSPSNRHCLSCHFPLTSVGGEGCAVCHTGTPSHNLTPKQPVNALHVAGANCISCHTPLKHPENGISCTTCHTH